MKGITMKSLLRPGRLPLSIVLLLAVFAAGCQSMNKPAAGDTQPAASSSKSGGGY
jgi:hypothetical protein